MLVSIPQAHVITEFRVRHEGARVVLILPVGSATFSWEKADECARLVRAALGGEDEEVGLILLQLAGRQLLFPRPLARELWRALVAKARQAEEQAKAEEIAADAAILFRAGAPFGLSDDPKIQSEAVKEAAWNRELRRCMPGGIKSTELFGAPTIVSKPRGGAQS